MTCGQKWWDGLPLLADAPLRASVINYHIYAESRLTAIIRNEPFWQLGTLIICCTVVRYVGICSSYPIGRQSLVPPKVD